MKKILLIGLISIIVLSLIGIHAAGFVHESFSQYNQDSVLAYYDVYDENIYTAEKDMENENLAKLAPFVDDFLDLLPEDTINRFWGEHWKIIISTRKPIYIRDAEYSFDYGIGGNTNHGLRIIYVYLNDKLPEYLLSDFIHEFGHFEDWENGCVSDSSDFLKLFNKNKNYVPGDTFNDTNYHLSSNKEFFACCYKDYFLYGDKLAKEAPAIYGYMKEIVEEGNSNIKAFYLRIFR